MLPPLRSHTECSGGVLDADAAKRCFTTCLIEEALRTHIDRVALLTGKDAYTWALQRLMFHEIWRTRSPFLPRHTKQERTALSDQIVKSIAVERVGIKFTAVCVMKEARKRRRELGAAGLGFNSEAILRMVQADLSTELLDEPTGRAYFIARLDQDTVTCVLDSKRQTNGIEE